MNETKNEVISVTSLLSLSDLFAINIVLIFVLNFSRTIISHFAAFSKLFGFVTSNTTTAASKAKVQGIIDLNLGQAYVLF